MTIANKLKQLKQSTDAIKASATALTGEVQTDLTSIAIILDTANPANATDILNMLGYTSTNAPNLYNAFLNSLNKEEGTSYTNDTSVLLPKLTLDEDGIYKINETKMFTNSTTLTIPKGKYYLGSFYEGFREMFKGCTNLIWVPDMELGAIRLDTYQCNNMFEGCTGLKTVGNLNIEGCVSMFYMFRNCTSLTSIEALNTSSVTNMSSTFESCLKLANIPQLDTSNVTTMNSAFRDCKALVTIPQLDTSNVTNMANTFKGCISLTSVPQLDYSSATSVNSMFDGCISLTEIPDLNLESATDASYLFTNNTSLVTVGSLNTPNVTNVSSIFYTCNNLERVASLDVKSVTNSGAIYGYGSLSKLRYMVLKNIGQSSLKSWSFSSITNWGVNDDKYPDAKQSLLDTLITHSYDRASAGLGACTIKLSSTTKALLTDDEITQIATKGYTIA